MLSETTASTRRLALVGLAKNTGKTETLGALLRELADAGRCVGVTSVGRDGEERDVIDSRIEKPRVLLAPGSLVATTDGLLRASGVAHELLEQTDVRTPLGRVLIARVTSGVDGPTASSQAIEVAGPSAAVDVRMVSDAMLAHGAEQVLIDGAVDRRAAASPEVSDGLVMATGAVLDRDIEQVVSQTVDAVALIRLETIAEDSLDMAVELPPRFVLTAEPEQIARQLDARPEARQLLVSGALPERFLDSLAQALRRRKRELEVVVADPTRVFLWGRGPGWFERQGVHLRTLSPIRLLALTVNPVAPQSHRFDSAELRARLAEAIPNVPIFDVLDAGYIA